MVYVAAFLLPAVIRELAKARGLPVFDATRVEYPERMRRRLSVE
jgi:hypothetical protein